MATRARSRTLFFLFILATALGGAAPSAHAQLRETKLVPSDGQEDDQFGGAIAIDGNRIVVGVRLADVGNEENAGAAYVYERIDGIWQEVQKLVPSTPNERDFFGESVALKGDYLFIGALGNDRQIQEGGAVYVYERIDGTWQEVDILYPTSPQDFHGFGWEIAFDGERLFISAPQDEEVAIQAGAVYRFALEDGRWVQREKFAATSADISDISFFGTAMGLDGDYLLVSSPTDSEVEPRAGAAYIFRENDGQWEQVQKLLPPPVALPDSLESDTFSRELALEGDWALIGASDDEVCIEKGGLLDPNRPNACTSGAVFAFQRQADGQWTLQQKIAPDELEQFDFFGFLAIAMEDGRAAIGTRGDDDACPDPPPPVPLFCDPGAIYLYELMEGVWEQTHKLTASDADSLDFLGGVLFGQGRPLGMSGAYVVGGAPSIGAGFSDDILGVGKAYVWKIFNRDPVARPDQATTQQDAPVTIDVFANDAELDFDPVTLSIVAPPANGTVALNPAGAAGKSAAVGTITYTPDDGFSGTDTFTYRLEDNDGGSDQARVSITVTSTDQPPSAPAIVSPEDGATVVVGGAPGEPPLDPETPFVVTWSESTDPDGDAVSYRWQLATESVFNTETRLLNADAGSSARFETTLGEVASLLDVAGVGVGSEVTLWHRVKANAGALSSFSPWTQVTLVRGTLTAREEPGMELPADFTLEGNYPNPFNPTTRIDFALPRAASVRLAVYDVLGREQAVLVEGRRPAGRYVTVFEAGELPSGVYVYRMEAGGEVFTRTMLLLK